MTIRLIRGGYNPQHYDPVYHLRIEFYGARRVHPMRSEVDQLLEDFEHIKSNAGSVGPDHPKVKKWVTDLRGFLSREGSNRDLKKFEQLEFVKNGAEMWSQHAVTQGNIRNYKADLDKVGVILEKMVGPPDRSSTDEKIKELLFAPSEETVPEDVSVEKQIDSVVEETLVETETPGGTKIIEEPLKLESTMDRKVEPNFEVVESEHLSASARDKAVDKLMADLKSEMKSSEPNWDKIEGVMGDMMGLKKTGELLEKLRAKVNTPGVSWESVREIMAELWSIKKDMVIDLLPTLLKT